MLLLPDSNVNAPTQEYYWLLSHAVVDRNCSSSPSTARQLQHTTCANAVFRYTKSINRASVGYGNLRIQHPKNCVGAGECGMLFAVNLPEELEEATLSYKVKFGSNYDWTLGGKLPGLCDNGKCFPVASTFVVGLLYHAVFSRTLRVEHQHQICKGLSNMLLYSCRLPNWMCEH